MKRLSSVVLALALLTACAKPSDMPGKKTLATYEIPAEALHAMVEPGSRQTQWVAPEPLIILTKENPYTAVIEVEGQATGAGRSFNNFSLVWQRDENTSNPAMQNDPTQSGSPTQLLYVARNPEQGAGPAFKERYVMRGFSFKYDQPVTLALQLEDARDMKLDRMRITIRTGLGETTWLEAFGALQYAAIGIVMLILWRVFLR